MVNRVVLLCSVLVLFTACGGEEHSDPADSLDVTISAFRDGEVIAEARQVVTPEGGIFDDSGFALAVPQGALHEDVELSLTAVEPDSLPADVVKEGILAAVSLKPDGQVFDAPVWVTVRFEQPRGPGALLRVHQVVDGEWVNVALQDGTGSVVQVGPDGHSAFFVTDHFSEYVVSDSEESEKRMVSLYKLVMDDGTPLYYPSIVNQYALLTPSGLSSSPCGTLRLNWGGLADSECREHQYRKVLTELVLQTERTKSELSTAFASKLLSGLKFEKEFVSDVSTTIDVLKISKGALFGLTARFQSLDLSELAAFSHTLSRFGKWLDAFKAMATGTKVGAHILDLAFVNASFDGDALARLEVLDEIFFGGPPTSGDWQASCEICADEAFRNAYLGVRGEIIAGMNSKWTVIKTWLGQSSVVWDLEKLGITVFVKWMVSTVCGATWQCQSLVFSFSVALKANAAGVESHEDQMRRALLTTVLMELRTAKGELRASLSASELTADPSLLQKNILDAYALRMFDDMTASYYEFSNSSVFEAFYDMFHNTRWCGPFGVPLLLCKDVDSIAAQDLLVEAAKADRDEQDALLSAFERALVFPEFDCVDQDLDGHGEGPDCLAADCDDADQDRWDTCEVSCTPDCAGKQCGDDGCGGSCAPGGIPVLADGAAMCEGDWLTTCTGATLSQVDCAATGGNCVASATEPSGFVCQSTILDPPPTGAILSPTDGVVVTTDFAVTITASDDQQLDQVWVNLSDNMGAIKASWLSYPAAPSLDWTTDPFNMSIRQDGVYQVTLLASDGVNLNVVLDEISVTLNTSTVPGDMVRIPAAGATTTFEMGRPTTDTWGYSDEQPAHTVTLDAYQIDKYEVTASEYKACVDIGVCTAAGTGGYQTYDTAGKENHPINYVDWMQAFTYCDWLGKRLPTEAEWERAAKGETQRRFPWGDSCPIEWSTTECASGNWTSTTAKANGSTSCHDGYAATSPVGSFPSGVSPDGVHDMAGNVYEWVKDWYGARYYSTSPATNPTGPLSGSDRVGRGGGWSNYGSPLCAAGRLNVTPGNRDGSLGFRCASSIP